MQELNATAQQAIQELSQRYGVSPDAVRTLLFAVSAGGGTMAQFSHTELGGGGQWMQGGMTMVGDMFNHGLQATVAGLCSELSSLLSSQPMFVPAPNPGSSFGMASQGNAWWPAGLGSPSSTGGQNDVRYAYFPQACRLVVERAGRMSVYNTLDHNIGGVQQQQGGFSGSLEFTSQRGTFTVESLPLVSGDSGSAAPQVDLAPPPPPPQPPPNSMAPPPPPPPPQYQAPSSSGPSAGSDPSQSQQSILSAIERLGELHQRGVLSDEEFRAKKSELLSRL